MGNETNTIKIRHTAAHVLAYAVSELYKGVKLGNCGTTDTGFHYDFAFDDSFGLNDLEAVREKMQEIVERSLPINTEYKPREDLIKEYSKLEQSYKREVLASRRAKRADIVILGENAFQDVCSSAVLSNTSEVKFFVLENVSGAYWESDDKRQMLTRISGEAFSSEEDLQRYLDRKEEIRKRDHKLLGKQLEFFSFEKSFGPGLPIWLPRGMHVRRVISDTIRESYDKLGAQFVKTPLLSYSQEQNNILHPDSEKLIARRKTDDNKNTEWYQVRQQMLDNHLFIFSSSERSYRELPWRVGEIGKSIRFEDVDELDGLNRVREITQDILTVICERTQIEKEVENIMTEIVKFIKDLGLPNFSVKLYLPVQESRIIRKENLFFSGIMVGVGKKLNFVPQEDASDDSIVDPEVILTVTDSMDKDWELAKMKITSSIPLSQGASYTGKDGKSHVPYAVSATISGSFERLIAVLIENYAGVLPLWLSSEHVCILTVTDKQVMYAERLEKVLQEAGVKATLDTSADSLDSKVKQAEERKVSYMLIIGEKEVDNNAVSVRMQKKGDLGLISFDSFKQTITKELASKSIKSLFI